MNGLHRFAAQGGYQNFTLSSRDRLILWGVIACGVIGIAAGMFLVRGVLAADPGSPKMREIAKAIQEGAEAFLKRQFRTIALIVVPLAVLIFFTATKVVRPDNSVAMTFTQNGIWRVVCFLIGAAFSGLTGFIGMSIAVRGNVRTAAAAVAGKGMPGALRVAFRTGAVTGLLCVGLGLTGAASI
ncbi:MAG TPA: sodium/proton-translocating pyrophosphatase, partial [Acidimicrobiales bacterium]|nr:sodium/proton-translocating pyrophosphatase [Acidimicrobiales bacterium]